MSKVEWFCKCLPKVATVFLYRYFWPLWSPYPGVAEPLAGGGWGWGWVASQRARCTYLSSIVKKRALQSSRADYKGFATNYFLRLNQNDFKRPLARASRCCNRIEAEVSLTITKRFWLSHSFGENYFFSRSFLDRIGTFPPKKNSNWWLFLEQLLIISGFSKKKSKKLLKSKYFYFFESVGSQKRSNMFEALWTKILNEEWKIPNPLRAVKVRVTRLE